VRGIHRSQARRPRRGASAVELAIVLPLLVTIVLGAVDFGRFAYSYIGVTNAARAGAAYAMMNNYNSASSTSENAWVAGITTAAQQEMFGPTNYATASPNVTVSSPSLSGTTLSGVTIDSGGLRRALVTVSYPFNTLVNWNFGIYKIPSSLTLKKSITVRLIR
jgi:Flp pilus assembly protein TadG